jgi:hypothetical protein
MTDEKRVSFKDEGEMVEWGNKIRDLNIQNKKLQNKIDAIKTMADKIVENNAKLECLVESKNILIYQQSKEIKRLYDERSDYDDGFQSYGRGVIRQLYKLVNNEEESDSDEPSE